MRIGIDVGGTNTDAVLMDGRQVVGVIKAATTADVSGGILDAVRKLLDQSNVTPGAITQVMVGTTHFVNAFVERKHLASPLILRIGLPAARGVPPTSGWPRDLRSVMNANVTMVEGGFQFNGTPIVPLDEGAVAEAARQAHRAGISSAAISCIFSHLDDSMERRTKEIFAQEAPDVTVTLSSEVGRIGMLERENAAIINASLVGMGEQVMRAFETALEQLGIKASLYVSQNDGTLMSAEHAARFPVATFASGPTNSMRGAAYLSGERDAIVADIGGTTTDVGALSSGFPREASMAADFGGVRTNFRMPDVVSAGLGGGSIVRQVDGRTMVGPESVGFRLTERALVFGGETLTATDIAVAAGFADVGDRSRIGHLSACLVKDALAAMQGIFNETVDRARPERGEVPLVLVGGGSILVGEDVPGTTQTIVPKHAAVANAIGASIAQVSGEVDRVYLYADQGRDSALADAKAEAIRRAVHAGAVADSAEVVDVLELHLTSMPGDAVRVRVRAVGDLEHAGSQGE